MKIFGFMLLFFFSVSSFAELKNCAVTSSGSATMDYISSSKQTFHAVYENLKKCNDARSYALDLISQNELPAMLCGCGKKNLKIGTVPVTIYEGSCFQINVNLEFVRVGNDLYDTIEECRYYTKTN